MAALKAYLEEDGGHRVQRLFRPRLKPVNDCVVDQTREVAAARAQSLAHRRHGQHNMQIVTALQYKLCPAGILAVIGPLLDGLQNRNRLHSNGTSLLRGSVLIDSVML